MLQVREKDLDAAALLDCALSAVEAAGPSGPRVFVNGRPDIALAAGAEGVQLPADGLPAATVKTVWGGRLRIGLSVHEAGGADSDVSEGADFLVCGPVFDTPSKRAYGPPIGVDALKKTVESSNRPVFAIGGINMSTIGRLAGIPVAGVAVISAILGAQDMAQAVLDLREKAS